MEDKQFFLTPELADRLAAIDIGTNSIRLIIAQPLRDGRYRTLDDEKQTTRLGRHLGTTGRLDAEAVEASLTALRRMKQIADGYQASQIRVIATCAVREAADGADFCRRAEQELGLVVEVISAEDEARLAFHSVARNFDLAGKNVLVADIGGGSTEMVLATGNVVESIYTAPLGAVRISDRWGECERASEFERMTKHIDRELRRYTHKPLVTPHLMIGSGGTFTALADMVMARRGQQGLPIRGY
jgi:exopolyphosphatase/guanosine-5'-triphosphate,3'-diphosphate pyrophosphatase